MLTYFYFKSSGYNEVGWIWEMLLPWWIVIALDRIFVYDCWSLPCIIFSTIIKMYNLHGLSKKNHTLQYKSFSNILDIISANSISNTFPLTRILLNINCLGINTFRSFLLIHCKGCVIKNFEYFISTEINIKHSGKVGYTGLHQRSSMKT